jgi:hypothetical protein
MVFPMLNLTEKQVDQLADVLSDIALLITASTIVPSFISQFEPLHLIAGAIISFAFWFTSIKIS